jgi:glycerol-3-phosphate dehydrogenase (NAD(P)+)
MRTVLVLGAGVMGTAFCFPLAATGTRIVLVGTHLDDAIVNSIRQARSHPGLPVAVPAGVQELHFAELGSCHPGPDLVVVAVSSAGMQWARSVISNHLHGIPVLLLTKGLDDDGERIIPFTSFFSRAGAVGGPCIASDLARGVSTSVVVAADAQLSGLLKGMLTGSSAYLPFWTNDVEGVELCAAFKNLLAIAVGAAGVKGSNPAARTFNDACGELELLCEALGGSSGTARGLAGVGDLYVTCLAGRNRNFGTLLGEGRTATEARHLMRDVTVEGMDLALAIGHRLRAMIGAGQLDPEKLRLTSALLDSILDGGPLDLPIT